MRFAQKVTYIDLFHSVSAGGQIDFFRLGKVQKMDSSQYVYVLTKLLSGFGNVAGSQKKNIEEKSNYSTIFKTSLK